LGVIHRPRKQPHVDATELNNDLEVKVDAGNRAIPSAEHEDAEEAAADPGDVQEEIESQAERRSCMCAHTQSVASPGLEFREAAAPPEPVL
jgi:hypothetical protein